MMPVPDKYGVSDASQGNPQSAGAKIVHLDNIRLNLCPARSIVIAFTGLHAATDFEYAGLLDRTDSATILVRDLLPSWYHGPLMSGEWGCEALVAFLIEKTSSYEQIVCIGSSMGGYAALMFGKLIGANRILAFSPQTLIDPAILREIGDPRYLEWLDGVAAHSRDRANFECARIVPSRSDCKIDVFVSKNDHLDLLHADRITGDANVTIHRLDHLQHMLVAPLRAFGTLRRLITCACNESPLPDVTTEVAREIALREHVVHLTKPIVSHRDTKRIRFSIEVRFRHPRGDARFLCRLYPSTGGAPILAWEVKPVRADDMSHLFEVTFGYHMLAAGSYDLQMLLWEGGFYYDQFGRAPVHLRFEIEPEPTITLVALQDERGHPIRRREPPPSEALWDLAPPDRWVRRFFPAAGDLKSRIGHVENGRLQIRTDGGGCGLFGPYVRLPRGRFVARVLFSPEGLAGAYAMIVTSDVGQRIHEQRRFEVDGDASKIVAEIFWRSEDDLETVEIVMLCDPGFRGEIVRLEIERLGD